MREPQEENVLKYFNALKELRNILQYTSKISMTEFSVKKGITKNLSNVLQKGGVVKNVGTQGRGAEWKWNTIEPTREMAIKTLRELGSFNTPKTKKNKHKQETKVIIEKPIKYKVVWLFGLIKFYITPIYK